MKKKIENLYFEDIDAEGICRVKTGDMSPAISKKKMRDVEDAMLKMFASKKVEFESKVKKGHYLEIDDLLKLIDPKTDQKIPENFT